MMAALAESELEGRERILREVIGEAGRLAQDWFERRASLEVALKGPQDYASEADAAVERVIRRRLAEAFPDDAFLGEEEGGEVGERVWVADPIDGTANFVRGVTRYCVSLAFVADGRVQLGAIVSPATNELYLARRGRGATLNGAPLRTAATDRIERAAIEIGWSSRHPYADYLRVIERMLASGGGELVTLVRGQAADDELMSRLRTRIGDRLPTLDVEVVDGGQARYPVLVGLE